MKEMKQSVKVWEYVRYIIQKQEAPEDPISHNICITQKDNIPTF